MAVDMAALGVAIALMALGIFAVAMGAVMLRTALQNWKYVVFRSKGRSFLMLSFGLMVTSMVVQSARAFLAAFGLMYVEPIGTLITQVTAWYLLVLLGAFIICRQRVLHQIFSKGALLGGSFSSALNIYKPAIILGVSYPAIFYPLYAVTYAYGYLDRLIYDGVQTVYLLIVIGVYVTYNVLNLRLGIDRQFSDYWQNTSTAIAALGVLIVNVALIVAGGSADPSSPLLALKLNILPCIILEQLLWMFYYATLMWPATRIWAQDKAFFRGWENFNKARRVYGDNVSMETGSTNGGTGTGVGSFAQVAPAKDDETSTAADGDASVELGAIEQPKSPV